MTQDRRPAHAQEGQKGEQRVAWREIHVYDIEVSYHVATICDHFKAPDRISDCRARLITTPCTVPHDNIEHRILRDEVGDSPKMIKQQEK
jgi:hypothetical protein